MKKICIIVIFVFSVFLIAESRVLVNKHQLDETVPCIWIWYPWYRQFPKYPPGKGMPTQMTTPTTQIAAEATVASTEAMAAAPDVTAAPAEETTEAAATDTDTDDNETEPEAAPEES